MSNKFKVLVLSDHALSTSGVGTQTRHLINGLLKKGCWSFRQFGAAMKHSDYRTVVVNDDFIINNKVIPSNTYQVKKVQRKQQTKTTIMNENFGLSSA